MDKIKKIRILQDCNNSNFSIDKLDQFVQQGDITIEEFKQYNLELSKVKELERRDQVRKGIAPAATAQQGPEAASSQEAFSIEDEIAKLFGEWGSAPAAVEPPKAAPTPVGPPPMNQYTPPVTTPPMNQYTAPAANNSKLELIEKVKQEQVSIDQIKKELNNNLYTYNDLEAAGISPRIIRAMQYYFQLRPIRSFTIEDLPPMDKGRTDIFFVGIAGSGKSVMLAGLLQYANKKGIMFPDTYNQEGNKYSAQLISDLERGILPQATVSGSYNYIAASFKDEKKVSHPLNIVEVPGENYAKIYESGIRTEEVRGFVNYIKNDNRKILVFVLDALEHQNRLENFYSTYKQGDIYTAILNMLKDNKILEKTDAIYIVVNKFDVIKKEKDPENQLKDITLAGEFVEEEFLTFLENCREVKERTRNQLSIKIFPFSIGEVCYDKILKTYNPNYSQLIIEQILKDSFVVKGGGFLRSIIERF